MIIRYVAILLSVCAGLAQASSLGVAGNYNVFTFGNFSGSSDTEGRIAVGGTATLNGFGVGSNVSSDPSLPYSLVVGGSLSFQNSTVNGGGIAAGGAATLTNVAVNGNVDAVGGLTTVNGQVNGNIAYKGSYSPSNSGVSGTVNNSTAPISGIVDFSGTQTALLASSAAWSSLATNGTIATPYSQLVLTGSNASLDIFNITAALLAASTSGITISAPSGATVLVNVNGTSASFPNTGFSVQGTPDQDVLFNFFNATSLTGSGGFNASILAPQANFTFNSGQINGNVVAYSMSGSGETHWQPFVGSLPAVVATPEPGTILLMSAGFGLLLFGTIGRRISLRFGR